ncbi:MAG: hypothetical protein CVU95_15430 [Firmicutes bacterium HGW-Firmicutes-2]|jgi:hypothetical protein|nr:MAG: hypothetical protein CVU95_15430 [Firmicutes bacterium HGW-Firmicutes-2]
MRKTQHVVPNTSGGWSVKKGGATKATKTFSTKKEAEVFGRQVAKNQKSELVIHNKDGRIQNTNSYGKDPYPPKDRR